VHAKWSAAIGYGVVIVHSSQLSSPRAGFFGQSTAKSRLKPMLLTCSQITAFNT
jgi:hypothetical protein